MQRDYLEEASSILRTPAPFADLLKTNPDQVLGNLVNALGYNQGLSSTMLRKAAAYALGQIGDSRTMVQLRQRYQDEQADGVRDALVASMTAIKLAPAESGHSQSDRCQIIGDVYDGRRPADWT